MSSRPLSSLRTVLFVAAVVVAPTAILRAQDLAITEFMAANGSTLVDADSEFSDWIELFNPDDVEVSTLGWSLTDDADERRKWRLPDVVVPPKGFLVVFASGKDRRDPSGELHTNFKLSGGGEFLALVRPNGSTASSFSPEYPAQLDDVSYGATMLVDSATVLPEGAPARYVVPGDDGLGDAWRELDFDDSGWDAGVTGVGFDQRSTPRIDDLIQTDIGEAMRGVNASAYLRIPFQVAEERTDSLLELSVKYDDAFVAWVNGVEIARSEFAPEVPEFNSRALRARSDGDTRRYETFVAHPRGALRPGRNVLAVQIMNSTVSSTDLLMLPTLATVQVRGVNTSLPVYFERPTPSTPNAPGFPGIAARPLFSEPSGAYREPFDLELGASAANAEIRFTLDGTDPTDESDLYTAPIRIESSVTVRARSFVAAHVPSPVVTASFVRLDESVADFESELPIVVVNTFGRSIPPNTFIDGSVLVLERGGDGMARLTDRPHFIGNAAFKERGSSTQGRPKKAYNFEIRDARGDDLSVGLLSMPPDSDWILYAAYNFDRALLRNPFVYELSNQAGRYAPRTRFCEVFVNSGRESVRQANYVGVYSLMEKIKRSEHRVNIQKITAGDNQEPEISGGYIFKVDRLDPGDRGFNAGGQTMGWVEPKEQEVTPEQRAWLTNYINDFNRQLNVRNSDPVTGYPAYIDVPAWIDHHIFNEFTKNPDGFRLSAYHFKDRGKPIEAGPAWDFDRTLGPDDDGRAQNPVGWSSSRLYGWYARLFQDPDWMSRYEARWRELRSGAMRTENMLSIVDGMAEEIAEAAERNFVRWRLVPPGGWPTEVNQLRQWIIARGDWMDEQLVGEPSLSEPGGIVDPGFEVSVIFDDARAEIFYTLNGPDPMGPGGAPAPEAMIFRDPIVISENTRIRARARVGSRLWTRMVEDTYITETIPLVVTEIMYNPRRDESGTHTASSFEFLELRNVGAEALEVSGLRISIGTRESFAFADGDVSSLDPGEMVLAVRDPEAFEARYGSGLPIAGQLSGVLSNGGQTVRILGPLDEPFFTIEYDDEWYPITDGDGYSLVVRDASAPRESYGEASNWRASLEIDGSPGRDDGVGTRLPGDVNSDHRVNISDPVALLGHLFGGTILSPCDTDGASRTVLDVDANAAVNLTDAVYLLEYLYRRGPAPALGIRCTPIPGCADACDG